MSDSLYDFTTTLLSFEADARQPSEPFVDRSARSGKWVFTSANPPLSTIWKQFGTYSLGHATPNDTIYREDASVVPIGSQDFCIEGWVNLNATQPSVAPVILISFDAPLYDWTTNAFGIFCDRDDVTPAGKLTFHAYNAEPQKLLQSTSTVIGVGARHIAVTRSGSTWRLFVNGVIESTATWSGALNDPAAVYSACIGSDTRVSTFRWYMVGYVDDFRITVGYPRYTANFTVPTAAHYSPPLNGRAIAGLQVRQEPQGTMPTYPGYRDAGPRAARRDLYFSGAGTIYGTVKEQATPDNMPLRRQVLLLDETTNLIVRETWSDATTGAYTFANVDPNRRYSVITYDYTHNYRAVIADNLIASVPA